MSLLLLVGSIPFMQPFNIAVLGMVVTLTDVLFLVTLALALVTVLYHSLSISLEETRHVWLLLGMLAAALDSTAQRPVQTGLRFSMKARRPSA